MGRFVSVLFFPVLLAGAALFVRGAGEALPPVVASHFDAAGHANGHMPRGLYLNLMTAMVVGAPLIVGLLPSVLIRRPGARINLPNREHWLAPGRREATLGFIGGATMLFGAGLAIFLCYVHWLVVRANAHASPTLPPSQIYPALAAVPGGVVALIVSIYVRFGRVPR